MKDRGIIEGFLSIFLGRIGELLIGMSVTPLLVRLLGSSQYGDYAFVLSMVALLFIVVEAGIFDGLRKYLAEDREQRDWPTHVFAFYVRVALVLSIGVALLVAATASFGMVDRVLGEQFTSYAYLVALMILGEQLFVITRGTLMGLGLESQSEPLLVVRNLIYGVVAVVLASLGFGVGGVLAGEVIGAIGVSVVGFVLVSRHVSLRAVLESSPKYLPRAKLVSFNTNGIVLSLLLVSLYNLDIVMIRGFIGSNATGYYKAALVVAELLWFAPIAIQMVFLQSASRSWSRGETERITALAARGTRYTLLFTLLLAVGIAVLARPFVRLYFGPEFLVAVTPLLVLLPGSIGFAVARPIVAVGQGKGELRPLVYATAGAALLNLVLNVLLVPTFGIVGAATATSIGYGTMLVAHTYTARRIGFDPLADLRPVRVGLTAALSGVVIYTVARVIPSSLVALAVVPPVGLAVYVGFALLTGAVDRNELVGILGKVPVVSQHV